MAEQPSVSRRKIVLGAAWTAPAVVVASAAPVHASSPPTVPAAAWSVTHNGPVATEGVPEEYFFDFDVNVGAGTLGTLTMTWTAAPGGFIGDSSSETSFFNWTGVGSGAADGVQRAQWIYTSNVNPVNGPILMNVVGSMAGIVDPDLPITVTFTASSDGSSYSFTVDRFIPTLLNVTPSGANPV